MATDLQSSLPVCEHTPRPYDGPSRDEVLALRHQYLSPGIITYYREPLMVVEGHMQYVWDETGRRYLDAFAGIVTISVGHCHPEDRRAGSRADRPAAAHDDDLFAPDDRADGREAGGKNAAGPDAHVFHQQRQRGERDRRALGPRVHGQPGRDRAAQRLSRRHLGADEPHGRRHLEVQKSTTARTCTTRWPAIAIAARSGSSIHPAA